MAKDNVNIITGTSVFDGALIRGNTGFDGVSESNSLVVNDRIMAFRRKLHASDSTIGNFTWKTSGNNFILSKGGKNFTISREGYAMQQVSNVANITPSYSADDKLQMMYSRYSGSKILFEFVLNSFYFQSGSSTTPTSGYFYIEDLKTTINYSKTITNYFSVTLNNEGAYLSLVFLDSNVVFIETYVFISNDGSELLLAGFDTFKELKQFIVVRYGSSMQITCASSFSVYAKTMTNPTTVLYKFNVGRVSSITPIPHDDTWTLLCMPHVMTAISDTEAHLSIPYSLNIQGNSSASYGKSSNKYSISSYTYEVSKCLFRSDGNPHDFYVLHGFDGFYSVKYNDDIYLNYANFAPISISHNGHKLLDLSGNQNDVGTHQGYLCAYVGGQWYRFCKTTYASPQCTVLANMLYMFNTTTVKNALFVNGGNITQYDGCCSAIRPVFIFCGGLPYIVVSGVYGGRCNPHWQNGQTQGTSDEFSLYNMLSPSMSGATWRALLRQEEFKTIWNEIPPYYGYFPSNIDTPTTAAGARVIWDSATGRPKVDLAQSISVPAVSNPPEIVPAIFGVTYSDEATKIYIRVSGSLYPLLFTTLGTPAFVYRLLTEEAIAGGDYSFVIQGGLYTFSGQTQRISSNNKWVCDARGMVFCGHSTRCAYFYCIWDRGLYGFFGDNELKKLISMERFPLPVSSNKVGNFVNIPSVGILMYSSPMGVVVVYNDLEQYCIIPVITDTIKENVTDGYITIGDYDYYLSDTTVPRQPIELTTQWYGSVDDFTFTEFTGIIIICTNQNDGQPDLTVEIGTRDDSGEKWETIETKINFTSSGLGWCKIIPKQPRAIGLKLHIVSQSDIMGIRVLTQPVDIQRGASK